MTDNNNMPYRKKADAVIIAIPLRLDTPGFSYNKWGPRSTASQGTG